MRTKKTKSPHRSRTDRVFNSISQAAGALGVSLDALREAKRRGCLAFGHNRVSERELLAWISEHPDFLTNAPASLRDQKLSEEIRKLRVANDAKEGALVSRAKVAAALRSVSGKIRAVLDQRLENEYPMAVAGLDVPSARIFGKRLNDQICEQIAELAKDWDF